MAQNRALRVGPVALTTTLTTNILNPAAAGSGVGYTPTASVITLQHIRITNKTASAATFSLWIGATGANAAGTEFMGTGTSVAANSFVDWFGRLPLAAADFLVGGSGTATALTITLEGEVGLA
ncbi:MAG: hypothetical protein ACRDZ4_10890 [Egibacteraceae bacterium]